MFKQQEKLHNTQKKTSNISKQYVHFFTYFFFVRNILPTGSGFRIYIPPDPVHYAYFARIGPVK